MISGKTKSGFEFEINENILNDWRLIKNIAKCRSEDENVRLKASSDMVEIILGNQEEKLCDHIKLPDGTIPTDVMMNEVAEIIEITRQKSEETKN